MTFYPCQTEGCKRKTGRVTKEGVPYRHCYPCNQEAKRLELEVAGAVPGVCSVGGCTGVTGPMKSDKTRNYKNCDSCSRKAKTFFAVSEVAYQATKAKDVFLALSDDDVIDKRADIEEKLRIVDDMLVSIRSVLFQRDEDTQPLKKQRTA